MIGLTHEIGVLEEPVRSGPNRALTREYRQSISQLLEPPINRFLACALEVLCLTVLFEYLRGHTSRAPMLVY